ncbi:hypothetical protein PGQ11_005482 [Apiospora arundinis]|uniref:Uncharacterized protein n=1 Tax=Apiospora arundinis TaxID=335852 RepID=A0ABR2JBK3_9PEZI
MAICRPPRSISPPSPVHLFHGILILGSGRKAPYVSIRILCALKWRCNSPGIHSVTRDNVVLRVKGTPLKGQLLKQEVCELIAKALEAPKPQNTYPTGPASWEIYQRVTGFLAPLRNWQSVSRKIEEPQDNSLELRMNARLGNCTGAREDGIFMMYNTTHYGQRHYGKATGQWTVPLDQLGHENNL